MLTMGFGDLHKKEADTAEEDRKREHRKKFNPFDTNKVMENERKHLEDNPANKGGKSEITQDKITQRKHANTISTAYKYKSKTKEDRQKFPEEADKPIGNLDSTDARMKFLNGFTQNNAMLQDKEGRDIGEHACGPTSVIAAAVAMDGPKGLNPLIDRLEKDLKNKPNNIQMADMPKYTALKQRIKDNKLTAADMVTL